MLIDERALPWLVNEELVDPDPGRPHARSVNTSRKKGAARAFILSACSLQSTGVAQRDDNNRSIEGQVERQPSYNCLTEVVKFVRLPPSTFSPHYTVRYPVTL